MKILYMCFIYQGLRRIGTILKHNYSAWMLKQARNRCNSLIADSKKWSIASLFNPLMLSQILLSTKFFASPNSLPHPIPTKIWSKDLDVMIPLEYHVLNQARPLFNFILFLTLECSLLHCLDNTF